MSNLKAVRRSLCPLFLLLAWVPQALAQTTNGCGNSWNAYLVPDSVRVFQCNFKSSCDAHDICYGRCEQSAAEAKSNMCEYRRCLPKGDLYGTGNCETLSFFQLRIAAKTRKESCDEKFAIDLAVNNAHAPACLLFVKLYPFIVKVLGDSAFIGGSDLAQANLSSQEKAEYAAALNQMFASWTEAQIVDFDARLQRGEVSVDLLKPVRFLQDKGLVNP